ALQRDPAHRYNTAGALAQDVEYYLAGDPITARPPSTIYFLRKRMHKHRVKLAVAWFVLALGGLIGIYKIRLGMSENETVVQKKISDERQEQKQRETMAKEFEAAGKLVKSGDAFF